MRFIIRTTLAALTLAVILPLAFGGCARRIGCSNLANIHYLGTVADLNSFAYDLADDLITGANPALMQQNPKMPILVTSFVDLNDLTKTNAFGRVIQRSIASRFVQNNYSVKEILLGSSIFIEPRQGETILTRDLTLLANNSSSQAVVVGTWTRTGQTLYLSVRAVHPETGNIISSKDYHLCMDDDILELFSLRVQADRDDIVEPHEPWLNKILPILNF